MEEINALKVRIYQESACFKKPFAFKVAETYPLPPYSTIKGFFHYIIGAESFIPMKISVQGTYDALFTNYQTMRFYKKDENTKMPLNIHLLYNLNLIIHVNTEKDVLNKIYNAIINSNEFFSIGRKEDLARIDDVKFVNINFFDYDNSEDIIEIRNNIYIPYGYINFDNTNGINYRLNYKYEKKDDILIWEKAHVKYIEKGMFIDNGIVPIDNEGDAAFFYPIIRTDAK